MKNKLEGINKWMTETEQISELENKLAEITATEQLSR